jgi:DNA processing protein
VRVPGLGAVGCQALLERCGTPQAVLELAAAEGGGWGLPAATLAGLRAPDWRAVEADLAWLQRADNHLLSLTDPAYPSLLRAIHAPPPVLFVHGAPAAIAGLQLGVVGSRNPTPVGRDTARDFAAALTGHGITVTSGLALGIDAAAHQGALDAGGITVAVAGTGLDRVYPASHRALAHRIAECGALVSEFPPGTGPRPDHFPRRNRIISGLSLGVLVVEAAQRSGSLITARHAMEQGREVFAIPGSIHNPLSRGCHTLIRQGAKLVEAVLDVLEELGPLACAAAQGATAAETPSPGDLPPEHRRVLDHLGYEPTPIDTLVERSGLTPESVSSILLVSELHGHVASTTGGLYMRVSKRGSR